MGYLWDEANTARLIDDEGWVHSGDLGRKDDDGFFFVTGRIKVSKQKKKQAPTGYGSDLNAL